MNARPAAGGPSLHRQLLWWLLLPQVVLWVAAALFTYDLAARYANEAIDASLLQASRALARQIKPTASGLFIDFPRSAQEILEADPNDRVLYAVSSPPGQLLLGDPQLATPGVREPRVGEAYFYDAGYADPGGSGRPATVERVRVVALYLKFGTEGTPGGTMLVQVARSRANREELARRILLDTALPLSALIGLMTVVVWGGIRAGLRPLEHLQNQVEGRAANDLAPIELRSAPPEVRSLAKALNSLLGEVRRHLTAQRRFISDAAHQLRTPLAGLKGQTELALGEVRDPELVARLQRVHDSATRSAHLVAQLLTLTRAEPEAAAHQDWATVDLRQLARETTAELVPRALAARVDLGFEDDGDATSRPAVHVRGVRLLLREALSNLIDNAICYAGRDATITVRVGAREATGWIEVEDDGPGLPADELEHVFERFVRGTQEGAGCGLGLSIVREIAERHGGSAALAPVSPHGLVARMNLPLLTLDAA